MKNIRENISKFLLLIYRKFIRIVGYSGKKSSRSLFRIIQFAAYSIIVVFIVNLFSLTGAKLGEFGDFFGGVLNPILTFLMLMGLIITIVIQRVELRLARNEFRRTADALNDQADISKKQIFENTFFQMIRLYNEIIDGMYIQPENVLDILQRVESKRYRGRDCIEFLYNKLKSGYVKKIDRGDYDSSRFEAVESEYVRFYENYGNQLGHYFRTIYNIIKIIDNSTLSYAEKKVYTNIIRSQLSKFELGLLVYNCLSNYGKEKLLPLVIKYDMLKHIELGIFEDETDFIMLYELYENIKQADA